MTWLVRTALLALVGYFAGAADAQTQTYYGLRFPNTVAGFPSMGVQLLRGFSTEGASA